MKSRVLSIELRAKVTLKRSSSCTTNIGYIGELRELLGLLDSSYIILKFSAFIHSDSSVTIKSRDGVEKCAKILGLDEYGYLKIQLDNGTTEVVHPDGNSFDMLRGLILPKLY